MVSKNTDLTRVTQRVNGLDHKVSLTLDVLVFCLTTLIITQIIWRRMNKKVLETIRKEIVEENHKEA
jgi:hypothetical protein